MNDRMERYASRCSPSPWERFCLEEREEDKAPKAPQNSRDLPRHSGTGPEIVLRFSPQFTAGSDAAAASANHS